MENLKLLASTVAQILKGNPRILGELLYYRITSTFSSVWDYMTDLGKPKLCTKFEVANFSHCVNIEGKPPNFGELS